MLYILSIGCGGAETGGGAVAVAVAAAALFWRAKLARASNMDGAAEVAVGGGGAADWWMCAGGLPGGVVERAT